MVIENNHAGTGLQHVVFREKKKKRKKKYNICISLFMNLINTIILLTPLANIKLKNCVSVCPIYLLRPHTPRSSHTFAPPLHRTFSLAGVSSLTPIVGVSILQVLQSAS